VSADPFIVHVARLRRLSGTRWHECREAVLDPDQVIAARSSFDTTVPEGAHALCEAVLESYPGGVMVSGRVRAPWQGVCRRCAVPVSGELVIPVRERFVEADPARSGGAAEMTGLEDVDPEAYPIIDDALDLRPMVRDAVVLELPLAPLCRPDCRGLCPECGADRNEEECSCEEPRDPRWATLDVLRLAQ
jgi:uncharacterized protein